MSTFAALYSTRDVALQHPGRSTDLDENSAVSALTAQKDSVSSMLGAKVGTGVVDVAHWSAGATRHEMFCGQLFEKVLVIPRKKDVEFVLSTVTFPVEIWNTHQAQVQQLTGINVTGAGGLQISGGLGSAAIFGPAQSSVYTATLGTDGDASIANLATFSFTGESGADLYVTGTRITVFPPEIDWSEGFTEAIEFKTDVLAATSGAEQRISLRTKPRYSASFRVLTLTAKDSAAMDALIFGWQGRVFGVPWWMDASLLLADVTQGTQTILVDTTGRRAFEAGGLVMLWTDQHTWEALGVQAVATGSVTLSSPTQAAWKAGTVVVPLRRGRLRDEVSLSEPANWAGAFNASFSCEVV